MSEGARSGGEEKERVARAQARFFLKMLNGFVPFSAVGERQAEAGMAESEYSCSRRNM